MQKKGKLELTWVGKYDEEKLEPRILVEDKTKSYGDPNTENMIIHGDNLIALKALEQDFAGKIKCIYIDPPYNTGSAFESYDDGLEHSLWLGLMKNRLQLLWSLLSEKNGVLLISVNDDECHYLKVLCDELFGRSKFVTSLIWNYEGNTDNQAKIINYHEYILVYSKTGELDNLNIIDPNIPESSKLYKDEIRNTIIKNGPKNPMNSIVLPIGFPTSFENGVIKKEDVIFPKYNADIIVADWKTCNEVIATSGWSSKKILESYIKNNFASVPDSKKQDTIFELKSTGAIEAVKKRENEKGHFVSVLRGFGTTNQMRLLLEDMGLKFTYPKPVKLIEYLIEAFTNENDIVLDSFAGSGTTAHAVMNLNEEKNSNRKFILVELIDNNAYNVIQPRLVSVIDGCPQADIKPHQSGFKFYELAEPLLVRNKVLPIYQLNSNYTFDMVAEAICKIEGFKYAPIGEFQGYSSENRFIHVTTDFVNSKYIMSLMKSLGENQSLLIYCTKMQSDMNILDNVEVKKIPRDLLEKCDFESEVER